MKEESANSNRSFDAVQTWHNNVGKQNAGLEESRRIYGVYSVVFNRNDISDSAQNFSS